MKKLAEDTWDRLEARFEAASYDERYRLNGRDVTAVSLTGGATALVDWVIHDLVGIPIPHAAAGFLGALLGLWCARQFKPGQ